MDLFYFFFHRALDVAKCKGVITFISTNYFITVTGAKVLRADFTGRATVRRMINFNEVRIFESAQGQRNMITVLEKGAMPDVLSKNYSTNVVDGGFDKGCDELAVGGGLLSRVQSGRVQSYLRILALAVVLLAAFLIWSSMA